MGRWQRFKDQERAMNMKDLYRIVNMGSTIVDFYNDDEKPKKGISVKLPDKTHEWLEIIAKSIPGMTKEKLVRFMIDAAIFDYCKEFVDSTLFPPDEDEINSAESLIEEAMDLIKTEGK